MRGNCYITPLLLFATAFAPSQTTHSPKFSVETRTFTAANLYWLVQGYFLPPRELPRTSLDASYKTYLRIALSTDDRRAFDLATIEFVAQLHNSHTFFWDTWLDSQNEPLGFYAEPLEGYWVVRSSLLPVLKAGDIITKIDDTPTEAFFQQQQRYIAASSVAAQRHNLFLLPYLFPKRFTLTLDSDKKVEIDREKIKTPEQKAEERWLKPRSTAYIKIPAFSDPQFEQAALAFVRQFQSAKTLILDVRNNSGGIPPKKLVQALMDRPYHTWKKSTATRFALVDADGDDEKGRISTMVPEGLRNCEYWAEDRSCVVRVTWGGEVVAPYPNAFRGRVILIVDGGCVSACEELVEPFKESGRGVIVGETTEGSSGLPYVYNFHNGMFLKVSVQRQSFPDGSEFEGVGIKPDVEIHPSISSLKRGEDVVLDKALVVATRLQ